jgi:hypothetical protein
VRDESHLDDMRSAIRGDFERLAERRGGQELMRETDPARDPEPREPQTADDEPAGEPWVELADELSVEPTDELAVEPADELTVESADELAVESADEPTVEPADELADELSVEPTDELAVEPADEPPRPSFLDRLFGR